MAYTIRRVAVIGAGTMGAAIAGLVAGAGLPVLLLDVPPDKLTPEEEATGLTLQHPAVRNRFVQAGYERMRKASPANLLSAKSAELIRLGNTEDDFEQLKDADWVLEAIIEQPEAKQNLMARLEATCKPTALITTNTSGIPISIIGAGRSADFRKRFFGTHFFNPPRYLKLLEVIPGAETDPAAVAAMRRFAENTLGKGVVICKDRPNFIGNRLGVFAMMNDLNFIIDNGYTVEEVDALTGPLIGRPSTATFRLFDQVGVDVMAFVAKNLYGAIPDDESREIYRRTELLDWMLSQKLLGKKAGGGFYKEVREGGKRQFWPLDLQKREHRAAQELSPAVQATIAEAQKFRSLPERLRFLVQRADEQPDDRAAQLIANMLLPYLAYAARRLPEISDSVADADNAMRWGFAHELGPFQLWDALGIGETATLMKKRGLAVAPWVEKLIDESDDGFYTLKGDTPAAYNVATGQHERLVLDERAINLAVLKAAGKTVRANSSASLIDLGDGVLCLEFHSKGNSLDGQIFDLGFAALQLLEGDEWNGLVIGNQGRNFCAGMNLADAAQTALKGDLALIDGLAKQGQRFVMSLRFAPKPVVVAPFGQTLGGGCEIAMHCARTVAAAETYIGLVEFGVGLIPGWGGSKELNRRLIAAAAATPGGDPLKAFQGVFETVSQAKVATSAVEARELGFLRPSDQIVFNGDYLIGEAKRAVLELSAQGYAPPLPGNHCYALGRDGLAAARIAIYSFVQGGFASEYDAFIAEKLAYVLCGGELSAAQPVSEQYLLDLERQVSLELLKQPKTHERIKGMLETGRPVRN
ncbi:MAG: 3-hydroxyacyl-CoA dehydrogenase NAD-binding domain-containing protein [Chloroflexaceae bacterium]|jgi:3-hydroxyacyl-CoA dehydrogenase|nr:3-hydroxyacyl-CoA dehydrogenase NAD-binding domain-containing protein [Chloroflexaceae bacterium]